MAELTEQVVTGYLNDLNGVWLAEDIEFLGLGGPSVRGRSDVSGWLEREFCRGLDGPRLDFDRLLIDGTTAAAELRVTGTDVTTGRRAALSIVGVFEVEGGEIVRLRVYGGLTPREANERAVPPTRPGATPAGGQR